MWLRINKLSQINHTVTQLQSTVNAKLLSKTCQNICLSLDFLKDCQSVSFLSNLGQIDEFFIRSNKTKYPKNFAFLIFRILELFACEIFKFLKRQPNFYLILLLLNVFKKTFHIPLIISMWNLQHIIFMWKQRYWQIFKSALV